MAEGRQLAEGMMREMVRLLVRAGHYGDVDEI
jgi:hypothetical protein